MIGHNASAQEAAASSQHVPDIDLLLLRGNVCYHKRHEKRRMVGGGYRHGGEYGDSAR